MSAVPAVINLNARAQRRAGFTGLSQVHETKAGRIRSRPVNGRVSDEFPIDVVRTTVSDMPPAGYHGFRRSVSKSVFRKNGRVAPRFGVATTPGTSKYPFGQMNVGNSFFIKLLEQSKDEFERVKKAVHGSLDFHIRRGNLPALFSLSSILAERNGELGVAFFRVQ